MNRLPPILAAGALLASPAPGLSQELDTGLRAFVEVVAAVRDRYIDLPATGGPGPMQNAIRGYLEALGDPATRYLSPADWQNLERSAKGSFQGFGMVVVAREKSLVVDRCYPGSPAERAGLLSGDRIVATGRPPRPVGDLDKLRAILAGSGTRGIHLALRRGSSSYEVHMRKGHVRLPTVEDVRLEDEVHYLRIHSFSERSPAELDEALGRARGSRGTVLDLRGNSGGVLDAAVHMAGLLCGPGPVTWVVDAAGRRDPRQTDLRARLLSPPSVVLVDSQTASAAEVLAAHLRRRGSLLVGTPTYGKGTIQEVLPLADGGAAVMTVARYEISPGDPLPDHGLAPDQRVDSAEEPPPPPRFPPEPADDPALREALRRARGAPARRRGP